MREVSGSIPDVSTFFYLFQITDIAVVWAVNDHLSLLTMLEVGAVGLPVNRDLESRGPNLVLSIAPPLVTLLYPGPPPIT